MDKNISQKEWLTQAKRNLSSKKKALTWDEFADISCVKPKTFKTYRMPEDSVNFRKMPDLVRENIERLLVNTDDQLDPQINVTPSSLLIPALASLVIRQARASLIDGRMISGTDKQPNIPVGLTPEDRRAMSLVSTECLKNSLPDYGSEIHQLLYMCTTPLGGWLKTSEVEKNGMLNTRLIDPEDGVPTVEAEELAVGFSNMTAQLDNQLFQDFMEKLTDFPESKSHNYYTKVRENVVRYPLIRADEFPQIYSNLPAVLTVTIQQSFYEPVPDGWQASDEGVAICAHCGNALNLKTGGYVCRTTACRSSMPTKIKEYIPATKLLRVNRGVKQYWVEPGFDEIRLYDELIKRDIPAELYPKRDLVDVSVENIGIDLKAYTSPETLANKFNRSIGGLAYYEKKWVVVPDTLIKQIPAYMERLKNKLNNEALVCLSFTDALNRLIKEFKKGGK